MFHTTISSPSPFSASPSPGTAGGGGGGGGGAGDEEGALRAIQAVMTAKPADRGVAEQMLRDAVAKVRVCMCGGGRWGGEGRVMEVWECRNVFSGAVWRREKEGVDTAYVGWWWWGLGLGAIRT